MEILWFILSIGIAGAFFYLFIKGPSIQSPLWLMFSAWLLALGVPRLHLSRLEAPLTPKFITLVGISLLSFAVGFYVWKFLLQKYASWSTLPIFNRNIFSPNLLRAVIYVLFILSLVGLFLFYSRAGNFPLLAPDPDAFRFRADEQVPGLINYTAQLARLYIPLAFYLIFAQGFSWRKHSDVVLFSLIGVFFLILFASRTQIYFIDLWVMALFLFMVKPSIKQALKFYPIFLLVSIIVLAAVPIIRQTKSYGAGYLEGITQIDESRLPKGAKYALPIYVGISFNMQSLQHAQEYYEKNPLQYGKVTLDPFTNIVGLDSLKSNFDLGKIFKSWWNTGTYLFPFVQDFGNVAFFIIPFLVAGVLTALWRLLMTVPNFLSTNLYAYACFFIVMTIYLSFTVRAEMYIDLFLLLVISYIVSKSGTAKMY